MWFWKSKDKNSKKETPGKPEDPLLRRARESLEAAQKTQKDIRRTLNKAPGGETGKQLRDVFTGASHAYQAGQWIYGNVLEPVGHVLNPWLGWAGRLYMGLWDKVVYVPNEDKELEFSKSRAGTMVIATFLATYYGLAPFVAGVASNTRDAFLYAGFHHKEALYLTQAEEYQPHVYSVKGCEQLPCDGENTVSFRIYDSALHDIVNYTKHGSQFYPDFVAGAVPPGVNKCEAEYYGFRWKLFSRYWHIYPTLLQATCQPVTTDETGSVHTHAPSHPASPQTQQQLPGHSTAAPPQPNMP